MHIPHRSRIQLEAILTKFRFKRGEDGTIVVRAERVLGKQLVSSITKVLAPDENISAAMKQLYEEVHQPGNRGPAAQVPASKRAVGS